MSYIRQGHPLQWFNDRSTEYVYSCGEGQVEDYNSGYEHLPSLIELIGHMTMWQTGDFKYATKIVVVLAYRMGIERKLRTNPHPYEEMELARGHDYREEISHWKKYFEGSKAPNSVSHLNDDDLADYNFLETFSDAELLEVSE